MDGSIKSWTTIHGTNLRTFDSEATITSFIKFRDLLVVFCNDGTLKIFYKDGRKLDEKKLTHKEKSRPCIIREVHAAQNKTAKTATSKFSLYGGGSDGSVKVFDMNYRWNKVKPVDEADMIAGNASGDSSRTMPEIRMNTRSDFISDSEDLGNFSSLGSMPYSSKSFGLKSISHQGSHAGSAKAFTNDSYDHSIFSYSSGPSFASNPAFSTLGSKPNSGDGRRALQSKPNLRNLALPAGLPMPSSKARD